MLVPSSGTAADRPRVLVTGADGLIGRAVAVRLHRAGYDVSALSLRWEAPLSVADRVFTGDAADEDLVADAVRDASAVVHMAAIPHPNLGTARAVFVGNTSATFTVLDRAGQAGIKRVVLASSVNAFGVPLNRHDVHAAYYPLDESSPVDHDDAYSLSKWVDEQSARWAGSRYDMTAIALRFPLVRPMEELRRHVDALRDLPEEQRRLAREGWAYLELADAVDAVQLALEVPLSGVHTAILAAGDILLNEPTELLLDRYAPRSARRQRFENYQSPVSTEAARSLLGWAPKRSIRDPRPNHNPATHEVSA